MTALTYLVGGWASLQAVLPPDYVSVIFIPAGVALGAVLVGGTVLLPGVFIGAVLVQWLAHVQAGLAPWTWLLLLAPLGAMAQAWLSAQLIQRRIGYPGALDHPWQAIALFFVVMPLGAMVNASLSVPALVLAGITPWDNVLGVWLSWWVGDCLGTVLFTPLVLAAFGQPEDAWRPRLKTVALPMLTAMTLIGLVLYQFAGIQQRNLQEQFAKTGLDMAQRLQRRLDAQTDAMVAIGKLMELSPSLGPSDFKGATQPWLKRYGGTQNFGWSPLVTSDQRGTYEDEQPALVIKGRNSSGQTTRAPEASRHLPLTWVEPLESNKSVLGLDILVLPATQAAVQATLQSRRPEVTEGIRLVQESGEQRGVVMYLSVHEPTSARSTPVRLKGVLSTVFRMDDALLAVLGPMASDQLSLCLVDELAAEGNRRLAGPAGCELPNTTHRLLPRWQASWPLHMAQREWTLDIQAGPAFWRVNGASSTSVIAATGLIAVALLGAFLVVISGQGRRTARLVEDRTQELAHSNASLMQLAHFDPLTGLTNRAFWMEQAEATLAAARLNGKSVAVIFLDLDRFKHINDSLGHSQGDRLLQTVADRLHACLRTRDVLARWGGDEFVALLPWVKGRDGAAVVANKIARVLTDPIRLPPQELTITASLGVAMYPDDGNTVETLLRHADTAMYTVKGGGRNSWRFFSPEMHEHVSLRLNIESRLRRALAQDDGSLYLLYQPQVDARNGHVRSVEALLRWQDSELGLVPPGVFIPVAEETGLIEPLGAWVMKTACQQIQAWHDSADAALLQHTQVSVNVSALEFNRPNFLKHVHNALNCMNVPPHRLELEITESLLMQPGTDLNERLKAITALGISLALDDFGTGYSSLGYLKRLPLSKLKIDRSFVLEVPGNAEDEAIIRATLSMAHDLGLQVVAEGVENSAQQGFLMAHGCDVFQGWLFSKALPPDALVQWLRQHPPTQPTPSWTI